MGGAKKLCVRRFDSIREVENFYNSFDKDIASYDIKVIHADKIKPNFLLCIEYFE
jgi:hypothetical protein